MDMPRLQRADKLRDLLLYFDQTLPSLTRPAPRTSASHILIDSHRFPGLSDVSIAIQSQLYPVLLPRFFFS